MKKNSVGLILKNTGKTAAYQLVIIAANLHTCRAGKIRFSGARKFVLLKASSGDCCAPCNFLLLVTLRGTRVRLSRVPRRAPNEIVMKR